MSENGCGLCFCIKFTLEAKLKVMAMASGDFKIKVQ